MNRLMHPGQLLAVLVVATTARAAPPQAQGDVNLDLGVHWFKLSAGKPAELDTNAVFDRWENINASDQYTVRDYEPLSPLFFNMVFGADALFRYRRHLMVKIGYDYTNPVGFGGEGRISYHDEAAGTEVTEKKSFSYTSHQISTFLGPIVSLDEARADLYLGFSPMAPTWVYYQDHYQRTEDGRVVEDRTRKAHGFFGSCRALLGMQVRVSDQVKLGSEAVFTFLNNITLKSGEHTESSFQFPALQWDFVARYSVL